MYIHKGSVGRYIKVSNSVADPVLDGDAFLGTPKLIGGSCGGAGGRVSWDADLDKPPMGIVIRPDSDFV